ncbi:MAG TPA: Hsp20/alpha crystallin family protein [Thermoanaerobaculia bacterium]|nr:Hsp20/alpha crystallin family protein [Thermoanaerobaculia bacterium]
MNLTRWEPYRELSTLQDRLNRAFGAFSRTERDDEMNLAAWTPPVDIAEEKDRIVITAELPGFKEDQIEIQTENGTLTLRGERRFEKATDGKSYHRVERSYGQFVRSFSLPNNVDRERIKADFANGLLKVELPKREDAKPRSIKITPGGGKTAETVAVK